MSSYTKTQNLEIARSQMSRFPQYAGTFDNWIEVRVCKRVKTKAGEAFVKDALAIARPEIRKVTGMDHVTRLFMTVWSVSNQCATSVEFKDLEILEAPVTLNFVEG
jgi:hypothetical protein